MAETSVSSRQQMNRDREGEILEILAEEEVVEREEEVVEEIEEDQLQDLDLGEEQEGEEHLHPELQMGMRDLRDTAEVHQMLEQEE